MKGGKKKSTVAATGAPPLSKEDESVGPVFTGYDVAPAAAAEEESREGSGGEEEEEGGGGDDVDEESEEKPNGEEEAEEKPKLAEGFYEIETIRKKRVRKGKTQYLIKWRGWPESANTWEPVANLSSCSDIIDAFEESMNSSKHSTARRRKRRSGVTLTQPKKKVKQQSSPSAATYSVPAVKVRIIEDPLPMAPLDGPSCPENEREGYVVSINGVEAPKQATENGIGAVPMENEEMKATKVNGTTASDEEKKTVTFTEGMPKVDTEEPGQSGRRVGSRKRKSGPVKKFTINPHNGPTDTQMPTITALNGSCDDFYCQENIKPGSLGTDSTHEDKFGVSKNNPIIRIIKPLSYSTSVVNDARDVFLTFRAMRSDGKEMLVDNRYLKAHYPLLLINFYEEHLRYTPQP